MKIKKIIFNWLLVLPFFVFAQQPIGGVSADLSKLGNITDRSAREDLLKISRLPLENARKVWKHDVKVWKQGELSSAKRSQLAALQHGEIEKDPSGSVILKLATDRSAGQLQDKQGKPWVTNAFRYQAVIDETEKPEKYRWSFSVQSKLYKQKSFKAVRAVVRFYGPAAGGKKVKKIRDPQSFVINPSGEWTNFSFEFMVPKHCRRLDLVFSLYGAGEARIRDVKLQRVEMRQEAVLLSIPWNFLDDTYCINSGDPALIKFLPRNEAKVKVKSPRMRITLSPGFEILGGNGRTPMLFCRKDAGGGTVAEFSLKKYRFPVEGFQMYSKPCFLIRTQLPPSGKLYELTYQLIDEDYEGAVKKLKLKVIAPAAARQPKQFISGIKCTHELNFTGQSAQDLLKLITKTGINAIAGDNNEVMKLAGQHNIMRMGQSLFVQNAYRMGGGRNRTPESYFRQIDGKVFSIRKRVQTCPVEVYTRGKYYRTEVLPLLKDIIFKHGYADHIMPNWEMHHADFQGCFCQRCGKEFADFMQGRAAKAEIAEAWPENVLKKWESDWQRFRSLQHSRICITLAEDIAAIGKSVGKKSYFIPAIAWHTLLENDNPHFAQYMPRDYMDKLEYLLPWGPYIFSNVTEKYTNYPGLHLIVWNAAKDVQSYVRKYAENPARQPKLIAMVQGMQCNTWITEPEAIAFENLCFFLNKWHGSMVYYFPRSYDHRYWNALADSNSMIAAAEKYIFNGDMDDGSLSVEPLTRLPSPAFPDFWSEGGDFKKRLPGLLSSSIVQSKAFKLGRARLAAVGNFWQNSEIFYTLRLKNLEPATRYTVSELGNDGKCLGSFSGSELARGITVMTGALRWSLLEIVPGSRAAGFSQTDLKKLFQQRKARIQRVCKEEESAVERRRKSLSQDNPVNDFQAIYDIHTSGVSLKALRLGNKNFLQLATEKYTALVDPARGGIISSLIAGGQEQVNKYNDLGIGGDALWYPAKMAFNSIRGYKITGIDQGKNSISITMKRTLSQYDKASVAGITLQKKLIFQPDRITFRTDLINDTPRSIKIAFRFNNFPRQLIAGEGSAHLAGNLEFAASDRRMATYGAQVCMVRFANGDADIDAVRKGMRFYDSKVPEMELNGKAGKLRLTFSENIYSTMLWDTGKFATLEAVYKKEEIASQGKASYLMELHL